MLCECVKCREEMVFTKGLSNDKRDERIPISGVLVGHAIES